MSRSTAYLKSALASSGGFLVGEEAGGRGGEEGGMWRGGGGEVQAQASTRYGCRLLIVLGLGGMPSPTVYHTPFFGRADGGGRVKGGGRRGRGRGRGTARGRGRGRRRKEVW